VSIVSEWHPPRPYCLPGCRWLDGHDGREPGTCMGEGGVLKPGPLDLVHRHPDIPVNVPVRNTGIAMYDAVLPKWPRGELWTPFRDRIPRAAGCYRMASGAMVHVKPDCRC
jgi:hypothetical protein